MHIRVQLLQGVATMERLKDIAAFGVWFLGLSYFVMWAATGPLNRAMALDIHPETLPPLLHLVGSLAAIAVCVRLLLIALRSARRPPADIPKPRPRFRKPESTVKRIKSRDHFGLRGLQQ
jgi:hypothetical protein